MAAAAREGVKFGVVLQLLVLKAGFRRQATRAFPSLGSGLSRCGAGNDKVARGSGQGLVGQECLESDSPERGGSTSIELTDDRWEELRCEVLLPNSARAPCLASRREPIHPIRGDRIFNGAF